MAKTATSEQWLVHKVPVEERGIAYGDRMYLFARSRSSVHMIVDVTVKMPRGLLSLVSSALCTSHHFGYSAQPFAYSGNDTLGACIRF